MSRIAQIIDALKKEWGNPREAVHRGKKCPFPLACSFIPLPADIPDDFPFKVPQDVREFWDVTLAATLFKDQRYGQWGVEVLGPAQAVSETERQAASRPRDFLDSDLVLAKFFGESDLLIIACDPSKPDFGKTIIALPIDRRVNWPTIANSFEEFLERLSSAQGDKYWAM